MKKLFNKFFKKAQFLKGKFYISFFGWSVFVEIKNFDIVLLLDGCRYNTFKNINFLPGKLEKRISLGSCTPEWARKSLPKNCLEDVIYISANPFLSDYYLEKWGRKQLFFHLEPVWDWGWNYKFNTVKPDKVIEAFFRLYKKYPNKKFFLHFMQPHHPFIGKTRIKEVGWRISRKIVKGEKDNQKEGNIYTLLEKGIISRSLFKRAYEDNLRLVLGKIEKIMPKIKEKKILITSDHGELLGEYDLFGHPEGLYLPELIEVPYFVWKVKKIC